MARWKLIEAHYLRVPGTVWEQVETDRETGKQRRKGYPVPLYLDPKDPSDWTHRPSNGGHVLKGGSTWEEGSIIVAYADKTQDRRDIIFEGDPTPGMEPLDDEAKEISAGFSWSHPIEELSTTFSDAKLSEVQEMFAEAQASAMKAAFAAPAQNMQIMETQKQIADSLAAMATAIASLAGVQHGQGPSGIQSRSIEDRGQGRRI